MGEQRIMSVGLPTFRRRQTLIMISVILATLTFALLVGCGDGLSGSATGQNVIRTEALQEELASMSEDLANLNAYYEDLEFEVEQTLVITRNLIELSEELRSQVAVLDTDASHQLDETRRMLWQIEHSLLDLIETREKIIGELLGLITEDITSALVRFSNYEMEMVTTSTQRFDELFEALGNQETKVSILLRQLFDIENTLKAIDLTSDSGSNVPTGYGGSDKLREELGAKSYPTFLAVFSGEQYQEWITGQYYRCTSVPCGHLAVTTWNDKPVYVKISGQSTDPNDRWYWAYIFKYSTNAWVIQYVSPALTDANGNYLWNAHRYTDSSEPWEGNWGDIAISPVYRNP